jgi:sulfite exporter TauE/SafE/plastocyanin
MNLLVIFLTGLTTGGLSCLAVQGGLLTSIIANQKEEELGEVAEEAGEVHLQKLSRKERRKAKYLQNLKQQTSAKSFDQLDWLPVTLFLIAKLIAHSILGFFLGWLGSKLQMSLTVRLIFQLGAALFMFGTAMNLLEVHPIFRYLIIQPPRFVRKWLKNTTHSRAFFTPAILGLMTVFIPCGVTQSMEVLAMSSGNAVLGAMVMGAFVLGTSPLFAVIGIATAKLSETFQEKFMKFAAAALIFLSLSNVNGVLVVLNSPITFGTITHPITYFFSDERFSADVGESSSTAGSAIKNGVQQVVIQAKSNGYSPNYVRVKAGVPVNLTLQTKDTYTCASYFSLKAFGIKLQLGPTDSQSVAFTPTQPGKYQFTCSMGMYKGILEVM